jgi:RNA-directed DNA polymerase
MVWMTCRQRRYVRINAYLLRWIRKKYRRYRGYRRATHAWARAVAHYPCVCAHWSHAWF